jgi:hypothetical protein
VALLGIAARARMSLPAAVAVLVYLLVPQVGAYALSQVRPVYVERYIMGIAGAYVICLAWGLWAMWSWARQPAAPGLQAAPGRRVARAARWMLAPAVALLLIGMSCYSLYNHYFVAEYRKSPGWREAAQYILAQARPGDLVIENTPDPSLTYYLDGKMDLTVQPTAAPVDPARLDRDLRLLAGKYRRAWFMPDDNPAWDGEGAVLAWLDRNGARLSEAGPGGMTVMLYELTSR